MIIRNLRQNYETNSNKFDTKTNYVTVEGASTRINNNIAEINDEDKDPQLQLFSVSYFLNHMSTNFI